MNDINRCISDSLIRCFADDTRISRSIGCEKYVIIVQNDLDKLSEWLGTRAPPPN